MENIRYSHHQVFVLPNGTVLFDLDFVPPTKITISQGGYARCGNLYTHRLVMNPPEGKQVDHINHNKLDNRRKNLRICDEHDNNKNRPLEPRNTSGYVGVYWNKIAKRWVAQICVNKKTCFIGHFIDPEQAALARDCMAIQIFGHYANLNFKELQ